MRYILLAVCLAVGACAGPPPSQPDPALVNMYKKDIEDQLGITRARQRQQACSAGYTPAIGMTEAKVLASCWGRPDHLSEEITAAGKMAVWAYPEGYVYLSGGLVTKIIVSR